MDFPLTRSLVPELIALEAIGSTNTELARRAAEAVLPEFTTCATLDQTAGRGRLDRAWTAPAGASLAASVLIDPSGMTPAAMPWLPLAAGLAMRAAVAEVLPGRCVGVKWPNDVLVGERKISGVLAEAGTGGVVLGAGLNIGMREDQLPVATATSLLIEGVPSASADASTASPASPDPDAVLAAYLGELRTRIAELRATGSLAVELREVCVTLGRSVRVEFPDGRVLPGVAVGILADGRLQVRGEDGEVEAVSAADVAHARQG